MSLANPSIDFDRLLRLRLVVARFGEMDGARWWNTKGLLGRNGALLMSRGFTKTHHFAQARVVFAVATARCKEVFDPPQSMTLWKLPAAVEDQFDACWHHWLSERERWQPFFDDLQDLPSNDLLETLRIMDLVDDAQAQAVAGLRRSAEGRAVPLSGAFTPDDQVLTLLAAAFTRGERGRPAIPYARLDG
ncbi:MAG: BrxE family protein [Deltaproteobacteria bacterium]|nr:MAG: BrxE family protein [Deltaproteobacteria bacterium]